MPDAASAERPTGALRAAITICVMLATLMQALDTTIANVALPHMQGSLSATGDQINWVLTSYIVAAAIVIPATDWLEARFGLKRLFVMAVTGFVISSMLCGAATSLSELVFFRILQGVFGAPIVPLSQAVLLNIYSPAERGSAMAIFGIGVIMGPIIGPSLGGWLTENYSWRWVFYVNLPVGILAAVGLLVFLSDRRSRQIPHFDWFGFAALGLGIGALQIFLDRGGQLDWLSSTQIQVMLVLSLLGFYLFIVQMLTGRRPLLDPALFRDRNFAAGQLIMFFVGAVLFATLSLLAPFLEKLLNYPVETAGLILAPRGVGTMIAMFVVRSLVTRVDERLLIAVGLCLTAFALYEMSQLSLDVPESVLIRSGMVQGFGFGFVFVPLSTATFATLPPRLQTQGTAFFNLVRNTGSSVGISFTTFLLTRNTAVAHSDLASDITPLKSIVRTLPDQLTPMTLHGRAALNALVDQQAATIAYMDNFWFMMTGTLCLLPLLLLFRRNRPESPSVA